MPALRWRGDARAPEKWHEEKLTWNESSDGSLRWRRRRRRRRSTPVVICLSVARTLAVDSRHDAGVTSETSSRAPVSLRGRRRSSSSSSRTVVNLTRNQYAIILAVRPSVDQLLSVPFVSWSSLV